MQNVKRLLCWCQAVVSAAVPPEVVVGDWVGGIVVEDWVVVVDAMPPEVVVEDWVGVEMTGPPAVVMVVGDWVTMVVVELPEFAMVVRDWVEVVVVGDWAAVVARDWVMVEVAVPPEVVDGADPVTVVCVLLLDVEGVWVVAEVDAGPDVGEGEGWMIDLILNGP